MLKGSCLGGGIRYEVAAARAALLELQAGDVRERQNPASDLRSAIGVSTSATVAPSAPRSASPRAAYQQDQPVRCIVGEQSHGGEAES